MASTVSRARSSTTSAHSTLAPSRANRIAVALPLPMTLPLERAPVTIATLPASLAVMRGILPGCDLQSQAPRGACLSLNPQDSVAGKSNTDYSVAVIDRSCPQPTSPPSTSAPSRSESLYPCALIMISFRLSAQKKQPVPFSQFGLLDRDAPGSQRRHRQWRIAEDEPEALRRGRYAERHPRERRRAVAHVDAAET